MTIVSDTSPLRYLAVLGYLDLLPELFGQVHCPRAVLNECLHASAPEAIRRWVAQPPAWLIVEEVPTVDADLAHLDDGEAAAIMVARRLKADVLLLDELKGRRLAQSFGFVVAGTLGILAQAGRRNLVDYHQAAQRLCAETNFRATAAVITAAWNSALSEH